jgi:hypothetical protein
MIKPVRPAGPATVVGLWICAVTAFFFMVYAILEKLG